MLFDKRVMQHAGSMKSMSSVCQILVFLKTRIPRPTFAKTTTQNVLLPMKWIAPESFNFGIFSEKTDVVRNYIYIATNIVYVIRNKKMFVKL